MFYADSMGFLGKRWGSIVVDDGLKLNLIHITAVPPWITTMRETLAEIRKFKLMFYDQSRLRLVTNQKELSTAIADKKTALILGMQNTPDGIMDAEEYAVEMLKQAGISIISPCYDKQNDLGSGWLNADFGLMGKGRCFLRDCAAEGIIVDLSHCGHRTARDIVSIRKKDELKFNLMASHGGCYSLYHHIRNLPDDVLKTVAELGGVVGISTLTFTNHETDDSAFPFKDHLTRAISLCGTDSVCVGSDASYILHDIEQARKEFEIMSKKLDTNGTQGARFPENPIAVMGPNMPGKLHNFCSPYPFSKEILKKIFGQNLLDFFKRALPAE